MGRASACLLAMLAPLPHTVQPALLLCRYVYMALVQPPWTPQLHPAFPEPFRRAARALLLAAHRHSAPAAAAAGRGDAPLGCHLAVLPNDALQHVIRLAAYPLSAWAAGGGAAAPAGAAG